MNRNFYSVLFKMLELTIPEAGEDTKNAKDLVFSTLATRQPLSLIELVNYIRKHHNVNLTYQGIKSATDRLIDKRVLIKENKQYKINKAWLLQLKNTTDKLLTNYDTDKLPSKFKEYMVEEEYASYSFTNLFELDNFWDDMLLHLTDKLSPEEPRIFLAHTHYSWWILINLGRETKLFEHMIEKGLQIHNLFCEKYGLNLWASKIYQEMGVRMNVISDSEADENLTLNVIGDTVIQVKYPPEIIERLEEFYTRYKTPKDMSLKEITEISHMDCDLKFIVFKNPAIAQSLTEKYLKYF